MIGRHFPLSFTRAWVRFYTRGLPPTARAQRVAELDSDIWEQTHDTLASNPWSVVLRCLLGVPADISWRLEQAQPGAAAASLAHAAVSRFERPAHWISARGLPGLVVLMSWLYLLAGFLLIVTLPLSRNANPPGVALFGLWCLLSGALISWGNALARRRRYRAAAVILVGSVPIGLALFVTILVPAATAAIVIQVVRQVRSECPYPLTPIDKRRYLPINSLRRLAHKTHLPAPEVSLVFPRVLDIGSGYLDPALGASIRFSRYVQAGAVAGFVLGILARIWMRTISREPVFSVGGTGLILIVFSGLGALVGLSIAWHRFGTSRRSIIVRAARWAPFLLMGPFMILFLPGLGLAFLRARTISAVWRRRLVLCASWGFLGLLALVFLGARQGPGVLASSLYLVLAWALYYSNRVALLPLPGSSPTPPTRNHWWSRNHAPPTLTA
jgi:hypothetical protein